MAYVETEGLDLEGPQVELLNTLIMSLIEGGGGQTGELEVRMPDFEETQEIWLAYKEAREATEQRLQ